ncbi:MAG TPA: riboflavin synthase [Streptosporangiaceae bacterium]|nr:riboflavin synthase [Streptosporangiaceae bacterium]
MFTGIVEELGEVVAVERLADAARLTVRGPLVTAEAGHGDSIAVNGVCLTVTDSSDKTFTADVMAETLRRTGLGALGPGSPVNLERPVQLGGRLGGHLVQGHADGTGVILSRTPGEHWDVVRIAMLPQLARYIVEKGSVTVDGVSLTVSALSGAVGGGPGGGAAQQPWFEVSLIPTTLEMTTLGRLRPGSRVNLEVDVIAKYVESLLAGGPPGMPLAGDEQPGARS